ncbi:MAG: DUF2271 domain-containing protein [Bryobacteraceae bacterium]
MIRLLLPVAAVLGAAVCGWAIPGAKPVRPYTFHHENVLGTSLELKVLAATEAQALLAEAAALEEIDRCAQILSAWDHSSEFSRWMRTRNTPERVSPELFEVLRLFSEWRDRTGGALDPAAEVVTRLWKSAAALNRLPSESELRDAAAMVRQTHYRLDAAARTATRLTGAPLALNSFAKSYIVAKAADAALRAADASGVMLDIGGDLVVRGDMEDAVSIRDPRDDAENGIALDRIQVRDRAVATSGSYRRGFDIGGRHYSHIVDPRTAQPVDHVISSTVVAQDAATAGALATAFSVMEPAASARLASATRGVEFLLAKSDGTRLASPGWAALALPRLAYGGVLPLFAPSPFEVVIQLELARVEDRRYRRPYVAVWVEDKDRFPVRTLALWYEKPRWLPDLKSWSRSDRLRSLAEGTDLTATVSSATRPPGKYTLKWDGNDNAGKPVKPGRYTVFIEAAREHGTYQMMRQEIDLGAAPAKVDLPANDEVAGAVIEVRKANGR